jgi:hypothetical protein
MEISQGWLQILQKLVPFLLCAHPALRQEAYHQVQDNQDNKTLLQ